MKGFKSASRHRDTDSGGVAWIWKQDLNVVAELENHLKDHSNERCWIKIKSSSGTIALAAAYLPVEGSNETGRENFRKILQILDKDTNTLEQEKSSYIYGDFNAHIGTPANDPLGIKGNKPKVGENGQDLITWLRNNNRVTGNGLNLTKGLWTYQNTKGSKSVLDLMIINKRYNPSKRGNYR